MISHETARKMAIKFARECGYLKLADDVEADYCVNTIFARAVRRLGKREVFNLYWKLPPQLNIYFTVALDGTNDDKLWKRLSRIEYTYNEVELSDRPERLKCFPVYFREKQRILFSYFKTKRQKV